MQQSGLVEKCFRADGALEGLVEEPLSISIWGFLSLFSPSASGMPLLGLSRGLKGEG
jgi:hypothetical protein